MPSPITRFKVETLIEKKLPLVEGALSPFRLDPVSRFYRHLIEFWTEYVLRSEQAKNLAVIALGVPQIDERGRRVVNFPIYLPLLRGDSVIDDYKQRASQFKLNMPFEGCGVGLCLSFLSEVGLGGIFSSYEENLSADLAECANGGWFTLTAPEERYGEVFKKSAELGSVTKHYVRPIVFDESGIFAALAVDYYQEPSGEPFGLILENLELLLLGMYKSYYTDFGRPGEKVIKSLVKKYGAPRIKWDPTGRVLTRPYLEGISRHLEVEPLDNLFPGAEGCLLLFCDGDGIKRINDKFGHEFGNEVIRMIGNILARALERGKRKFSAVVRDGFVTRWAGDEFVVVAAIRGEVSKAAGVLSNLIAGELASGYEELSGALDEVIEGKELKFNISIGWRSWTPESGSTLQNAWMEAEQAMYVAKEGARLLESLEKKQAEAQGGTCGENKGARVALVAYEEVGETRKILQERIGVIESTGN